MYTSDPETITRCAFASKAKVLSVINDVPADPLTGASLVLAGDSTVRAREIVYLIDQTGRELMEGSVLPVVGLAGDAVADSADLRIRVDGLALEADPSAVRLEFLFEGRVIDVQQPLQQTITAGVRELEYRLPLGRDHQDGETITMEVAARFPDGRESGWEYRDLRLRSSYWNASVGTGRYPGTFSGWRGKAQLLGRKLIVTLEGDPDQRPSVLVNINTGDNPLGTPGPVEMCKVEISFSPSGSFVADIQANQAANVCSGGQSEGFPPAALVEVRRVRDGWVEGWATGTFFRGHPYPPDPLEQGPVRIDFRVPLCEGFGC
jgi:hypothetical protein